MKTRRKRGTRAGTPDTEKAKMNIPTNSLSAIADRKGLKINPKRGSGT